MGANAARKLAQADLKLTVTEFLLIKIFVVALGFMFGQFLGRGAGLLSLLFALIFAGGRLVRARLVCQVPPGQAPERLQRPT